MSQPSLRKNYAYRLFYEILILLTPFITTPYISRVLGAEGIGVYSFTSSIMTYFTLFATLGTKSYGSREIAQNRDDAEQASKIFWEIELITVVTSILCMFIWVGVILAGTKYRFYFIALLPLLFGSMLDISWYFTGYEKIKYIVLRNSLCKVVGIVLLFVLIHDQDDLLLYMVVNSLITLFGNLTMWTYLPKMLTKVDFHKFTFQKHIHETLLYFIPTIATSIYTVLDKTLIGVITQNASENGYYEQATKTLNIVKSVVFVAVNSVMGARISYLFAQGKDDEIRYRIQRSMDFIILLGFGAMFGIIGIAENFTPLFFGEGYKPVISLLYVMAPLVLVVGVSNCLGSQYYTPSGQRAKSTKYILFGSLVNLSLNLLFIPTLGGKGAALGSVFAELVISALYIKKSNGYMTIQLLWKFIWKRFIAGSVMCTVVYVLGKLLIVSAIGTLALQVMVGVCTYGILLLFMKDRMTYELLQMVRQMIWRKL